MNRTLALLPLAALLGCTEVIVVDDPNETNGEHDPADPPGELPPTCSEVPVEARHDLRSATSATLFGDVLHIEGVLDDRPSYVVLTLGEGSEVAELHATRPDLVGGATWTRATGTFYTRIEAGQTLAFIDAADPLDTVGYVGMDLGGSVVEGFERAVGVSDGTILLCMTPYGAEHGSPHYVDLSQPGAPGVPTPAPSIRCDETQSGRGSAGGGLWVTWATRDPSWNTDGVTVYDLSDPESPSTIDHGFAVDGVHHYGYIQQVETDGFTTVATLENDNYVFFYYNQPPSGQVVYSSFGGGDKKLVAVIDGRAYVVREDGDGIALVRYDVREPLERIDESGRIALVGAVGTLDDFSELAHDEARLVLRDQLGQTFVIDLEAADDVHPLLVVDPGVAQICE